MAVLTVSLCDEWLRELSGAVAEPDPAWPTVWLLYPEWAEALGSTLGRQVSARYTNPTVLRGYVARARHTLIAAGGSS